MDSIRSSPPSPAPNGGDGNTVAARADAAERIAQGRPPQLAAPAAPRPAAPPLRRSLPGLDTRLQGDVASAQQALDFLQEVAGQLQSLKSELSAKLSNLHADERQMEAQLRELASTLARRRQSGGDKLDAQLNYSQSTATQRFSVSGMTLSSLKSGSPQMLPFSLGGSQALTVYLEPGMSDQDIVQRFDRALAPGNVRVSSDADGKLVFSTPEAHWPALRDNLSILGRGRVVTEQEPGAVAPMRWGTSDTEALRLSLQEVVRALSQVRSSQAAASRELSAAASRAAMAPPMPPDDMTVLAKDFAATATDPNYESLLAITSAMVGISRERVLALLGLR